MLETRDVNGRLEAKIRWRAHGPEMDSWEDALALGVLGSAVGGTVAPGLHMK